MARVEVEMPQMGESVMEGTVIEWLKKVGDEVEEDETLLEIATDKVDTEIPSPSAGVVVEILAKEGDTIEVGQKIAVIETDKKAALADSTNGTSSSEEEGDEEDAQAKASEETESQEEESAAGSDEGERIEIKMPQMGESVMEGTVIEWLKSVGDKIEEDEPLLEVATDKVDTEIPSSHTGTVVEILADEGDTIEVGQTIAVIATGEAASVKKKEGKEKKTKAAENAPSAPSDSSNGSSSDTAEPRRIGSDGRFYSPLVRSIAKEEGISQDELEGIKGSGQGGRVSKKDIMTYLEERKKGGTSGEARTASRTTAQGGKQSISAGELNVQRPSQQTEIIKMDRMRKTIAEHMVRSQQISAHVTTFAEADVTQLVRWREKYKKEFLDRAGVKLTFTPLFLEAIIQAIREFPLINSSVDTENDQVILKRDINVGIAVALGEGGKGGLVVPVIKQAQDKNLVGLAKEVSELAEKARTKNLNPDDLVGGTITLTNYGSVGNLMGTPIINQPQVAILGTGVIQTRPVVMETDEGDVIAIRHMMYLTMSYDHRIIDGAHGGAFLDRVKQLLEDFDSDRAV